MFSVTEGEVKNTRLGLLLSEKAKQEEYMWGSSIKKEFNLDFPNLKGLAAFQIELLLDLLS